MSDAPAAAAPAKAPKAKKAAKPKAVPTHPKTTVMIMAAVKALKDRKGSSLAAIKKYIAANYKCDTVKLAPFIKKGVKSLVEKKALVQTKGKGASGSFKAAAVEAKPKKAKKPKAAKKPKKAKSPKKAAKPKKAKTPKKAAAKKPKAAKPAKKAKTPKKAAKPKAAKPKKAAPKKKASPKKAKK